MRHLLVKGLCVLQAIATFFYCDSFLSLLHAGVDVPQTRESRVLGSAFPDPLISGNASQRPIGALLRTQTPFKWDFESRMVGSATPTETLTLSFAYDADGMRTAKSVNGVVTRFVLDKNRDYAQVLEERDATASVINVSYIYGDDLISQERGASVSFFHYDGQLSTRQLTDGAANITDSYTYDAFGVTLASSGTTPNNYLYTGEQLDPNVGFYYLRARYLNQLAGRFVSRDPFPGLDQNPASLHKYSYALSDPIRHADPSGLFSLTELLIVQAVSAFLRHSHKAVAIERLNTALAITEAALTLATLSVGLLFGTLKTASFFSITHRGLFDEWTLGFGFNFVYAGSRIDKATFVFEVQEGTTLASANTGQGPTALGVGGFGSFTFIKDGEFVAEVAGGVGISLLVFRRTLKYLFRLEAKAEITFGGYGVEIPGGGGESAIGIFLRFNVTLSFAPTEELRVSLFSAATPRFPIYAYHFRRP